MDDHALLRGALCSVLNGQPDMEVVGEAADGPEGIETAARLAPDVILLDVALPGMHGTKVAKALKQLSPSIKILALSAYENEAAAREMISAGADGYVRKSVAPKELVGAIRQIGAGVSQVDAVGAARPDRQRGSGPAAGSSPLTADETKVLKLYAQGYPSREIASEARLDAAAVKQLKAAGMRKLGLKTRADVARFAVERGWISASE